LVRPWDPLQQPDFQAARNYWKVLKNRLNREGSESVTKCNRLKLEAADGKRYLTDEVLVAGRQPQHVKARSLLCFWANRELVLTATSLACTLRHSQPAITMAMQRGERLVRDRELRLDRLLMEGNL